MVVILGLHRRRFKLVTGSINSPTDCTEVQLIDQVRKCNYVNLERIFCVLGLGIYILFKNIL